MDEQPHSVFRRMVGYFGTQWWPLCLPLLLTSPAIFSGLFIDDHFHRMILNGELEQYGIEVNPILDLFGFLPTDETVRALMNDWNTMPWWSHESLRANFFRPITALTHMLDYALWPNQVWLHHLHSILWAILACFAVRKLYRITALPAAALAFAMCFFVVDEAHAMPTAWIANRNIMIALYFGAVAIVHYIKWRQAKGSFIWCFLYLLLSLLSAEGGISAIGYMIAWSLVYENTWRQRIAAWLPIIALVLVWRIPYGLLEYGEWGSGIYADPISDPLGFLMVSITRLPTLLLGQWFIFPTEITIAMPSTLIWCTAAVGIALTGFLIWQFRDLLRADAAARFWGLGMLLALIPVCATLPMNRLLYFAGVGAFALLGIFLSHQKAPMRHPWFWVHGPLAALVCLMGVGSITYAKDLMEMPERTLPEDINQEQHVIYFSGVSLPAGFSMVQRINEGKPRPATMTVLSHCSQDNFIERIDPQTLSITARNGWFRLPLDRMFRSARLPMVKNEPIRRIQFTATVVQMTEDNRPKTVHFRFDHPLEDARYRWMCFREMNLHECGPPTLRQPIKIDGMFKF